MALAGKCPFHPADLATSQRGCGLGFKEFESSLVVVFFNFFCSLWFNVQGLQGLFCQPSFVMGSSGMFAPKAVLARR